MCPPSSTFFSSGFHLLLDGVLCFAVSKLSCNYIPDLVLDRRKATRGGVKLDDTIELDLSDTEERTAAFTTANNTAAG